MVRTWLLAACLGLSLTASLGAAPALAQESDRVVVTASMISNDESEDGYRAELPYVSIVLPADFILFTVDLTTATRSPDVRKDELTRMFQTVTQ
ncbi:MAG: hypothetical protein ABI740_03060, partial [Alphaproteobacteria bacterium]